MAPIRKSLTRPDLILGIERYFLAVISATAIPLFTLGMTKGNFGAIGYGVFIWLTGLFLCRKINQSDPLLAKVFLRQRKHKKFYPAKSQPWAKEKSIRFDSKKNKYPTTGLSDLLPYAAYVGDGILINKDGSFTVGYSFSSVDTDSNTTEENKRFSSRVSKALKELGNGWIVQVDAVRVPECYYPGPGESSFPDPITQAIDDERRAYFTQEDRHYTTEHILYLTYKPDFKMQKLSSMAYTDDTGKESAGEEALLSFMESLEAIEDSLKSCFSIARLTDERHIDEHGQEHLFSPLLSHIQHAITGLSHPILLPKRPMYLDVLLGSQDITGGTMPKVGEQNIAVIALDGFPHDSYPQMLSVLESIAIPYRFNSRYLCMDNYTAQNEVNKFRKSWAQKMFRVIDLIMNKANPRPNRDASLMHEDAEQALTELQLGYVGIGYYSGNIVLLSEDKEQLANQVSEVRQKVMEKGFGARVETINALEAWLGTHPANGYSNVRRVPINSLNLADILPLLSVWKGKKYSPCPLYPQKSRALFYAVTGNTVFRFNPHVGDLGHMLVVAPPGAGKSTFLGIVAAQFRGYAYSNITVFDKGMSMYALCTAAGGTHYEVAGEGSKLAFCPLQHVDSDAEQSWAAEWIEVLATMQGVNIRPHHKTAINAALTSIRESDPHHRTLSDFYHQVQDQEIKEAIEHYTQKGAMGKLFDAQEDSLGLSSFTVFETEELMNLGEKNLLPALLYLFHRVEKSITGKPSLLILDEAWVMLGHPVFKEKIREWAKVLRKANCSLVLATQSFSDAQRSGILDVLNEACPTTIFPANDKARQNKELYSSLGLNNKQVDIISNLIPKREYYTTSPEGCRVINLKLSPLALAFVGVSSKEDIATIKGLQEEYGEKWVNHWLKTRGVNYEIH